jgi:uncharacterized protein (DUF2132 family)
LASTKFESKKQNRKPATPTPPPKLTMSKQDPLHGLTLEAILTRLVEHYDWQGLAKLINLNCFSKDPSLRSSLKFLRTTPWAREKVERLYLETDWQSPYSPESEDKAELSARQIWDAASSKIAAK